MIFSATVVLLVAQAVVGATVDKRHEELSDENTPCSQSNNVSSSIATYQVSEPGTVLGVTTSTPSPTMSSYPTNLTSVPSTTSYYGAVFPSSSAISNLSSSVSGFYLAEPDSVSESCCSHSSTSGSDSVYATSHSSVALSSSVMLNSSAVPSTSVPSTSDLSSAAFSIPSSTTASTIPGTTGYPVGQQSSLNAQLSTQISDPPTSSDTGCVSLTTETVYVTAPGPTTNILKTVHVTSTQFVTVLGSLSSVIPLSSIVPTTSLGLSTSIDEQSSSSVIFTIPEFSMVQSSASNSEATTSVVSSAPAPTLTSSLVEPTSLVSTKQLTPFYYPNAPHSSYGRSNSTRTNPTSTEPSLFLTPLSTAVFGSSISSSSALLPSNGSNASKSGGYSMAANSTPATTSTFIGLNTIPQFNMSSSSTFSTSHSDLQPSSSQKPTETITLIPPKSSTIVVVVPTMLPSYAVGNDAYEAAYKANKMYKRDATNTHVGVQKTTSNNNSKLVSTSKSPSAPSISVGSTNRPKPTSVPTSRISSKSNSSDGVNTISASQDPRCPYPYPGIHCDNPTTSVTTVEKPTATSKNSDPKKTGSIQWCPYPYPGGKGEACP